MADIDGRLPLGTTAQKLGVDWPSLLQDWRLRIERLASEFCNGHATVTPQARACEFCHLRLLCRIGADVAMDEDAVTDGS